MHAAVVSSFAHAPQTPTGAAPRVLWRVDRNAPTSVLLYIASPDKPDLTHLVEQAGWPTTGTWESFSYTPFLERIKPGEVWAFRLTANPVHSIRRKDGEPTKRTAHITPRHQLGWLLKQQDRGGFTLVRRPRELMRATDEDDYQVVVRDHQNLAFGKDAPGRERRLEVTLVTATYDGRLQVADPDKLRTVLTQGLGKAKAYGCGLMTLAPAG
jgi:CRISPR system Cascade subunit CasE